MVTVDLDYERPPLLYPVGERPPVDAWDVQVPAPTAVAAWIAAGRPAGLYGVGAQRAISTVTAAFPRVPARWEGHHGPGYAHPHVHVLLASRDVDGHLLAREQVQRAADEAWIAQVDRMAGYARERPHLGLVWRPDGTIAGVDDSAVPAFSCVVFVDLERPAVIGRP